MSFTRRCSNHVSSRVTGIDAAGCGVGTVWVVVAAGRTGSPSPRSWRVDETVAERNGERGAADLSRERARGVLLVRRRTPGVPGERAPGLEGQELPGSDVGVDDQRLFWLNVIAPAG